MQVYVSGSTGTSGGLGQTDNGGMPSSPRQKLRGMPLHSGSVRFTNDGKLAHQFKNTPDIFSFMELDEYIDLVVDFIELLSPAIIIERFFSESPAKMLIYPKYGLKNFEVKHLVEKRLEERAAYQGRLFNVPN
mgnify:CR=1 FL=1